MYWIGMSKQSLALLQSLPQEEHNVLLIPMFRQIIHIDVQLERIFDFILRATLPPIEHYYMIIQVEMSLIDIHLPSKKDEARQKSQLAFFEFTGRVLSCFLTIYDNKYIIPYMNTASFIHEMRGTQFPFGFLNVSDSDAAKTLIKIRYSFKDTEEYEQLMEKIDKLKEISHKNAINLRSTNQEKNWIELFYQYIPYTIEDAFNEDPGLTVKQVHRQFIELAIFLAKHCMITTFNPNRCGVIMKQGKSFLKYYLPLPDITVTSKRSTLQRFVQLFNVQSMQYLDYLVTQGLNTTFNESCSQRTFKNRVKLFPFGDKKNKLRKESQPIEKGRGRKLSNNPYSLQKRKLSTLSKQLSEISEMHKQHKASTRSGGSFNTFQSIISLKSQLQTNTREKIERQESKEDRYNMKRCVSDTTLYSRTVIESVICRSKKAIESLQQIKQTIRSYQNLHKLIEKIHQY